MKEALDFFVVVCFVLLITYLLRGFILQVQDNEKDK